MNKRCHSFTRATLPVAALVLAASTVLTLPWQLDAQRRTPEPSSGLGKEWPVVGGDLTGAHYSPLAHISPANVQNLAGAWVSKPFDEGATSRGTPVIAGGLMFVTAGTRLYALDARTGDVVWKRVTDPTPGVEKFGATGTAGSFGAPQSGFGLPSPRGVTVGDGKVFIGLRNGAAMALDQKTGDVLWNRQLGDDPLPKRYGFSVTEAMTYWQGIVFTGMAGDFGVRVKIVALDANTGKELWTFFPVPGPGEFGHDTWPQNSEVWKWGGGGIWTEAAIDSELGLVYYTTGNSVPEYGGERRPGDNLFTSSVVALEAKTGKLRWYQQLVHHDIWGTDIGTQPILYDAAGRKAVAVLRPDGYFFFFDRATGKPLMPIEERAVPQDAFQKTAPTQPFPVGVESLLPPCAFWKDKIPAGFILGCGFTPKSVKVPNLLAQGPNVKAVNVSYSPHTGYFYAQATAGLSWSRRSEDPHFLAPEGKVPGLARFGFLEALDSRTGKIAWKKEIPPTLLGRGGTLSTAGLLFRLGADGKFTAYDEKTGDRLWDFQTGVLGGAGTPAAYEIGGEQYIAVPAGPVIWTFKLNGSVRPRPAVPLPQPDRDPFTGPIEDTWQIETTSFERDPNTTGQRYFINEHAFNPYRARVRTGQRVTWVNNGTVTHTMQELQGAWTTGQLEPGAIGFASFPTPGRYTYICKEHPWAYGQIIVQDAQTQTGVFTEEQARRGRAGYLVSCGTCHGEDLAGRDAAPALIGPGFMGRWGSRNIEALYDKVRTTMPPANPQGLGDQTYMDIVSFMLQANDLPAGPAELNTGAPALRSPMNADRRSPK